MAAQAILYAGAQNAGSVSVNDADLAERGEHRVVDEFLDLGNRFIQRHAAHIQLLPNGSRGDIHPGFPHGFLAFQLFLLLFDELLRRRQRSQIGKRRAHFHHADLELHVALAVRRRNDRRIHIHGGDVHHIARLDALWNFAAHFLLVGQFVLRLFHLFFDLLNFVLLRAARFFHGAKLGDHGLRLPLSVLDDALGLFLRLSDGFFTLIFELFPLCFRLIADGDHLVARLLGQFALLLGHLTVVFGVGNHVLKANLLLGKQLLRPADDKFRQAELPRNFKCIGFSGDTDGQTIRRSERRHVEFNGSVFNVRRGQRIFLQFTVMRRGHRARMHIQQGGEHRLRQRRALRRICARAKLVKEHERIRGHTLEDRDNVRHVTRKGGKRLFDGLLVADVRENVIKNSQLRAVFRRNLQAGLRHQRKQTRGL